MKWTRMICEKCEPKVIYYQGSEEKEHGCPKCERPKHIIEKLAEDKIV